MRIAIGLGALACLAAMTAAADGLQNAAQTTLGATATFTGAPNNKDWPANGAIPAEPKPGQRGGLRGGCMFGAPMENGTIRIHLIVPCEIERVDLMQLDYHGTMNVKRAEISVDGKVLKTVDLEELPGKYQEIPLAAKGQLVSIKCLDTFPRHTDAKTGKPGPNWGGWARIRVMVKDDVAQFVLPPETYKVEARPEALTPSGTAAHGEVKVFGEPRVSKGHPCTTWDREDVAEYRKLLKTSPEFARLAESLRRACDKLVTQPIKVPQPKQGADGKWLHLSDGDPAGYGRMHNQLSLDIANLGTAYQLFGDDKYAEHCKKILLAYAEAWPNYGIGARNGFSHDPSKVFDQRLGDATWLIQVAIGFDFIHDWKGMTDAERELIKKDLVAGEARFIFQNRAHLRGATNWSAIGTGAILAAGYACDDEDLVKTALFGVNWTDRRAKRKGEPLPEPNVWWEGNPNPNPSGVELHFSQKAIDVDGMWCEGAMGYQFMALQALVLDAEILWHHGIDLYRYRGGALKCIFDSPILFAYPTLLTPAIHDSGNANIVGREAYLYEYGYKRYRDPEYLRLLQKTGRRLGATFQQFTVSCLYDIDFAGAMKPAAPQSVNLNGVGYGVLRVTDDKGTRNLLLDYGPNRSHGHPDKLNLDLWAFGELQIPDPGSAWYETPIYRNWFRTTFAHNTLSVDMQEQAPCGAELLVYAPGDAFGMMRARTDEAYPGVTMDRAVFMTRDYVADLFGAFSRMPRTYDLTWHPRGNGGVPHGAKGTPFALPEPRAAGYSELKDMQAYTLASGSLAVPFENKGLTTTFHAVAAEEVETTLVTATANIKPNAPAEHPLIERRIASETIFGNVFDLSGKPGNIVSVGQFGSAEKGFVSLSILKADKSTDHCFAVMKDGAAQLLGPQTSSDAQMGFLSFAADRQTVRAMALAGGTQYFCGGHLLKLSVPGGAIVERTETGSYLIRNTSSVENTVTFSSQELKATYTLKPGETREYLPKGAKPIADYKAEMLKKLAAEAVAAEAKAKAELAARIAVRQDAAKAKPGAKGTKVVVEAEDFAAQGGGEVRLNETKTAIHGKCFSHWDAEGQWLEWKAEVPSEGYYNVSLVYCTDGVRHRELVLNGETVADTAEPDIPATGGFANGSDDWRVFTYPELDGAKTLPVLFKAGENTLRIVNTGGGGVNLDYILVTSPDVKPERIK